MWASRIPRWVLPAALAGVLAIGAADAVLMRRHKVGPRPPAIPEAIGLHADPEGDGLRVQWDRNSRPVRGADHAILFIEDGTLQSQLDLTGQQLDGSSVLYWPESEHVTFRLEVYRGSQSVSDLTALGLPQQGRKRRMQPGPARAVVQKVRPSPFERGMPEIEVTQTLPARVIPVERPEAEEVAELEPAPGGPPTESRFDRVISKIPLLRRLRKHPPEDGNAPR
jgi:hypothetical protein